MSLKNMIMAAAAGAAPSGPTTIGEAYGGGYYAGKISTTADGVPTHYLIVAPRATGESSAKAWGVDGVSTNITSVIDGPTNTASLAALGASYQAATFCKGLNIGGFNDWYLPAKNELEVLYYFLKPDATQNATVVGANNNAVSPEPIGQNYSTSSPAITSATAFKTGGSEAFTAGGSGYYWCSTEFDSSTALKLIFSNGYITQYIYNKPYALYVRAVRRVKI